MNSGLRRASLVAALSAALSAASTAGCASTSDTPSAAASASASARPSATTVASSTSNVLPAASAAPEAIAQARAGVVEAEAATLKKLGGTYLCDQRIYPQGDGRHISAWEWAFAAEPEALATQLAPLLAGAEREGLVFRFMGSDGRSNTVVEVRSAETSRSILNCGDPPSGTRTYVMASRF